jgi:hypothetical protein
MEPATHDAQLRQAAFSQVNRLAILRGGVLGVLPERGVSSYPTNLVTIF